MQATGVREDLLLVTVLPGKPTASEFYLVPDKQFTEARPEKSSAHLDQVEQREQPYVHYVSFIHSNVCLEQVAVVG